MSEIADLNILAHQKKGDRSVYFSGYFTNPLSVAEILASNIGGTSTLIGDPPNIMIGSAAGLGFMDFVTNLALPLLVILMVTIAIMIFIFRKQMQTTDDRIQSVFFWR